MLEHVQQKLFDFFDQNKLQLIEIRGFLLDDVVRSGYR